MTDPKIPDFEHKTNIPAVQPSGKNPDKRPQILDDVMTSSFPDGHSEPEGKTTERQDKFARLHDKDFKPEADGSKGGEE
jgi:hypothetical protein